MPALHKSEHEEDILFDLSDTIVSKPPGRLSLRLTEREREQISELLKKTPANTPTDVLRSALMVYHRLIMEHRAGNDVQIKLNNEENNRLIHVFK